jgi:hypothetical protein
MAETFRRRFPPPWKIVEVWDAFEIYDSHGIRVVTIHAVERPTTRRCGRGIRLNRQQGLTLARAICRFANTGFE